MHFIIWKMPSTEKAAKWLIEVVYRDLVFLRSERDGSTALIDLAEGEGMVVVERKAHWRVTKFSVSDSLNDVLFDTLDGVEVLGVPGDRGVAA